MGPEDLTLLADSIGVGYKECVGPSGLNEDGLRKKIRMESLE